MGLRYPCFYLQFVQGPVGDSVELSLAQAEIHLPEIVVVSMVAASKSAPAAKASMPREFLQGQAAPFWISISLALHMQPALFPPKRAPAPSIHPVGPRRRART